MKTSAGLLVYRRKNSDLEVLLVHNGGPFFAKKDKGEWSLPKGEISDGEEPLDAAKREFEEELGLKPPEGKYIPLGESIYPSKQKKILAWAVEGDIETNDIDYSNVAQVSMHWPPKSGQQITFPEVDRAEWFDLQQATIKLFAPNLPFLERLAITLGVEQKEQKPDNQTSFL